MLALVPKPADVPDPKPEELMQGETFSDHFTPADRERLIKTAVNLENLTTAVGKLESAIGNNNTEVNRRLDRFEDRIRFLENWRYWMIGAAAGVGALAGWFGYKLHA